MGKSKKRKHRQNETEGCSAKIRKEDLNEVITEINDESVAVKKKRPRENKKKKMRRIRGASAASDSFASSTDDQEMLAPSEQQNAMETLKKEKLANQPQFHVDLSKLFAADGPRQNGTHLHCNDIKNLMLFTMLGTGRWDSPNWCKLISWQNVKHTLLIMVDSVSREDYVAFKECFPSISSIFPLDYPIKNDGGEGAFISPLQSFLFYTMKKKSANKKKRNNEVQKLLPSDLVLSKEQRFVNEFPVVHEDVGKHSNNDLDGWVSTQGNSAFAHTMSSRPENSQMFAIDCEMCTTAEGRELTRVSVVNENLEIVYETYVKPKAQIVDYLTRFSGITPEVLKDVQTRLGDVQLKLMEIISPDDIIVGHSLENDMRALKIYHENYIDTSIIYGDQRGTRFKPSLKVLVKQYLRREIQNNEAGHCSNEDAKACMELVQLKLEKGIQFGVFTKPIESIFEAFSRCEKKSAVVDLPYIARQHCFSCTSGVLCNSDEEVVNGAIKSLPTSEFVFAHLKDYERLLKAHDTNDESPDASQIKETLRKIDVNIKLMIESVPSSSLVICLFSSGFLSKRIQSLQRNKEKRKEAELTSAIRKARDCACFIKVQG